MSSYAVKIYFTNQKKVSSNEELINNRLKDHEYSKESDNSNKDDGKIESKEVNTEDNTKQNTKEIKTDNNNSNKEKTEKTSPKDIESSKNNKEISESKESVEKNHSINDEEVKKEEITVKEIIEENTDDIAKEINEGKDIENKSDSMFNLGNMGNLGREVEADDRKVGLSLARKVNVGYLLGMLKGGITQEEKQKVKEHLKDKLSEQEYEKAKQLIYKYLRLLNKRQGGG